MTVQRILVVDDDALSREFLTEAVHSLGYSAISATNGEEALKCVEKEQPDVIITDMRMPGIDGLELVKHVHEQWVDLPTVLVTAHGTIEAAVEAM